MASNKKSGGAYSSVFLIVIAAVAIFRFKEYWPYIAGGAALVILLIVFLSVRASKKPILYIGNKATKTYHVRSCRTLSNVGQNNIIGFSTAEEAQRKGYKPCNICKP